MTTLWTVVSGPGTVTFTDNTALASNAQFDTAGSYVLQLAADDGELQAQDELTVVVRPPVVNQVPVVSAGDDQLIVMGGVATLAGSGVHGPVAALRALPGLGADWGPEDSTDYGRANDFTPCSAFGGQQPSGYNGYTWGTGSPGCGAAGLAPVAVSRNPRRFAC